MIATISPGMSCCEHTLNTLRYADRVKELGVDDVNAVHQRAANNNNGVQHQADLDPPMPFDDDDDNFLVDEELPEVLLGGLDSSEDQLSLLRSIHQDEDGVEDTEATQELLHFHQMVDHIELMEEEINDGHRLLCDEGAGWLADMRLLFNMSDKVDYDVDEYSSRLESMLSQKMSQIGQLREKVSTWRAELHQEEQLSSQMQARKAAAAAIIASGQNKNKKNAAPSQSNHKRR